MASTPNPNHNKGMAVAVVYKSLSRAMHHRPHHLGPRLLCGLAALFALTACNPGVQCREHTAGPQPDPTPANFAPFNSEPRARIGSLPFGGPFTLFKLGDPDNLGSHRYGGRSASPGPREKRKGIIYTRHGGFLDIAHLRKSADWTAYHSVRIKHALANGWPCVVLPCKEPSVYHLHLHYPPNWGTIPEHQRQAVIDEASIRLAQRMAITQTHWHEIITWFGHSSLPMISEKGSAFTYDDTTSHILGAHIAGLALRDKSSPYAPNVTRYLTQELKRLGAATPDETLRAIAAVKGKWWRGHRIITRQLDLGLDDGQVTPWLIPNSSAPNTEPQPFLIPTLDNVAGHDLRSLARIEIHPRIFHWPEIRRALPDHPHRPDPEKHFPLLLTHIRAHDR